MMLKTTHINRSTVITKGAELIGVVSRSDRTYGDKRYDLDYGTNNHRMVSGVEEALGFLESNYLGTESAEHRTIDMSHIADTLLSLREFICRVPDRIYLDQEQLRHVGRIHSGINEVLMDTVLKNGRPIREWQQWRQRLTERTVYLAAAKGHPWTPIEHEERQLRIIQEMLNVAGPISLDDHAPKQGDDDAANAGKCVMNDMRRDNIATEYANFIWRCCGGDQYFDVTDLANALDTFGEIMGDADPKMSNREIHHRLLAQKFFRDHADFPVDGIEVPAGCEPFAHADQCLDVIVAVRGNDDALEIGEARDAFRSLPAAMQRYVTPNHYDDVVRQFMDFLDAYYGFEGLVEEYQLRIAMRSMALALDHQFNVDNSVELYPLSVAAFLGLPR